MFSLISNSPLSDVLAPPVSSLDEFIFQWNTFSCFFIQDNNDRTRFQKSHIDVTNLPNKLIKMCDIIVTEQLDWIKKKKDPLCLSPCMEYLLQNNILETLSLVAQADTPIGICPHIILFITRILNDSKVNLVPHKSAHTALNKLVIICGKIQASPYESTEMYFLTSLVKVIHKNPHYLHFFSSDSFPLINSLLSLLYSEDCEISKQAADSIIKLMQILDEDISKTIIDNTPFCCKIINQIINHYNAIPHSLKIDDIESILHFSSMCNVDSKSPTFSISVRKFLCFLKWYIFFDMLIHNLPEDSILACNLLSEFKTNFLESSFLPDLTGDGFETEFDAIDSISLATVLISNCLRNTENSRLFDTICYFLILSDSNRNSNEINIIKNDNLKTILLKRCHISNIINQPESDRKIKFVKLSSVTLQLFEDILSRPSFEIVNNLIIRHLFARNYLDEKNPDNVSLLDKQVNTYVSSRFDSISVLDQMHSVANEIHNHSNMNRSSYIEMEHLNQILYLFISLIPDELKFDAQHERVEYEAYLKEAVKGFHIFMVNCFHKWEMSDSNSINSNDSDDELNFIEIIFDNLSSLFEMPYDTNLQMFSIWAKISLIPNELINEYFLDPTICLKEDQRSLFNILHKLIEDLQISVKGIDNLHQKLKETKTRLLGEETAFRMDDSKIVKILESLIVLEEFCKELSSIIYAKNYILKICKDKSG